MKKLGLLLVLFAVLITPLFATSIEGTVYGNAEGNAEFSPLEGVNVFLVPDYFGGGDNWKGFLNPNNPFSAMTDENGHYVLNNADILAGDYFVVSIKEGYEPQFFDHSATPDSAQVIAYNPETDELLTADFHLNYIGGGYSPETMISGTVQLPEIPEEIYVMAKVFLIDADQLQLPDNFDITADNVCDYAPVVAHAFVEDGSYVFPNVPYGNYYVVALAHRLASYEIYQESADFENATIVSITEENGLVDDINFTLEGNLPQPGIATLSGNVTNMVNGEAASAEGFLIHLVNKDMIDENGEEWKGFSPNDPEWPGMPLGAITDENGAYAIVNVPVGEYYAIAVNSFGNGGYDGPNGGSHDGDCDGGCNGKDFENPFFQIYNGVEDFENATIITIAEDTELVEDINFNFEVTLPTAKVAGYVFDINGEEEVALASTHIHLIPVDAVNDSINWKSFSPEMPGLNAYWALSAEDGSYEIDQVAAGEYYAVAVYGVYGGGHGDNGGHGDCDDNCGDDGNFDMFEPVYQIYNGVEDFENATIITVTEETDIIENIDFHLNVEAFTPPVPETVMVTGTVIDETTGTPIESAEVVFFFNGCYADSSFQGDANGGYHGGANNYPGNQGGFWNSAVTDENGFYQAEVSYYRVDEETVELIAMGSKWDGYYEPEYYDNVADFENATPIFVAEGAELIEGIDFSLASPWVGNANLSGTVVNEDGEVIEGALVNLLVAYNEEAFPGQHYNNYYDNFLSETNENGEFNFENIKAGGYVLHVSAYNLGYLGEFYENAATFEDASVIELAENETVSDIQVVLAGLDFKGISGLVKDAVTEEPIENAYVFAMPTNHGNYGGQHGDHYGVADCGNFVNGILTAEDGSYELNLPQGDYVVAVFADSIAYMEQFYNHKDSFYEADVITLADEDITDINFDLISYEEQNNNSISGNIYYNSQSPDFPVFVVAVSSDEDWVETAEVQENGFYRLPNLPLKEYYVLALSQESAPTYYEDVQDFEEATAILADGDVTDININLTPIESDGILELTGYVYDQGKAPIANTSVIITDADNKPVNFAMTNSQGYYSVTGIVPDDYKVIATKIFFSSDRTEVTMDNDDSMDFMLSPSPLGTEESISPILFAANFPNPFNPKTTISFNLPVSGQVSIEIFNVLGQKVKSFANASLEAGKNSVVWEGKDDKGAAVSSGIYFYKIKSDAGEITNKMLLVK